MKLVLLLVQEIASHNFYLLDYLHVYHIFTGFSKRIDQ